VTTIWDREVNTERNVVANRLGITVKNRKEKMCIPMNVSILAARNFMHKDAENEINTRAYV
jgi:hypothetical protein